MNIQEGFNILESETVEGLVDKVQKFQDKMGEKYKQGGYRVTAYGGPVSHQDKVHQVYYVQKAPEQQTEEEIH